MNTTAAAAQAHVTPATIRTWCRKGVIAAIKSAGRWIIEAASLTRRITLGKKTVKQENITPITRQEFERKCADLGLYPVKDTRCLNEYRSYTAHGAPYADDAYNWAMIARGAALDAQGWTPPAPAASSRRHSSYAERTMTALTGLPSGSASGDCHYCGLDPRDCDCI